MSVLMVNQRALIIPSVVPLELRRVYYEKLMPMFWRSFVGQLFTLWGSPLN